MKQWRKELKEKIKSDRYRYYGGGMVNFVGN